MDRRLVNVGCGSRYHPDWVNIDIVAHGPGVIAHDVSRGLPLDDASCDAVYHSAVLEHIRPGDAVPFIRECRRVLRPGGVLRVAVPDLERICEVYLEKLRQAVAGDAAAGDDREWMMLELFDQAVRERGGGLMVDYLRQDPVPNEAFVLQRIGVEGRELLEQVRRRRTDGGGSPSVAIGFFERLRAAIRRRVLTRLVGPDAERIVQVGRFRLAGEAHQWMYDRYSLARLLLAAGFVDPVRQEAVTSRIADWTSFNLDTLADGTIVKPDLFYMEASTPGGPRD